MLIGQEKVSGDLLITTFTQLLTHYKIFGKVLAKTLFQEKLCSFTFSWNIHNEYRFKFVRLIPTRNINIGILIAN